MFIHTMFIHTMFTHTMFTHTILLTRKMFVPRNSALVATAAAVLFGASGHAFSQEAALISVTSVGEASAPTESVDLRLRLAVKGDDFGEALQRLNTNKVRVQKALSEVEVEGLEYRFSSLRVSLRNDQEDQQVRNVNNFVMHGNDSMTRKSRYEVDVVATLPASSDAGAGDKLWEQLGQVLDLSQEVGLELSGSPLDSNPKYEGEVPNPYRRGVEPNALVVRVKDEKLLRQQACSAGLEDAREQASEIAKACGVKLGEVHSVKITSSSAVRPSEDDLARCQINVTVAVSFRIAP